jgi:hypothetical protein
LPYTVADRCVGQNSTAISCDFKTNNTAVTATFTDLQFAPGSALGVFNASVNCSQGNFYTIYNFDYTIVDGKVTASPSSVLQVVSDCEPAIVRSDSFGITANGGITPRMIEITPTNPSPDGDILSLVSPNPNRPSSFLYSEVIDGLVSMRPKLINSAFSFREAKLGSEISGPSPGALLFESKYNVKWTFCPRLLTSSNITITTSSSGTPVVITKEMVTLTESHGLNVWEQEWKLTTLSGGKLEYYCPDNTCDAVGKIWLTLSLPATIRHVHIS